MKNPSRLLLFYFLILSAFLIMPVEAQEDFTMISESKFEVLGSSTFGDWDMASTSAQSGTAKMKLDNGKILEINSLEVSVPVESLKSGKSGMESDAYEALKYQDHPNIEFELTEVLEIKDSRVKAKGNLKAAGVTRNITLEVDYKIEREVVTFTGTHDSKFSNFRIDPPRALLGAISTDDALTFSFEAGFKK